MAAIVCHGLQSHLESQLVESRTLRLRFPSSKPLPPPQAIDLSFKSCFWDSNIKTQYEEEEENNIVNNNKTDTIQDTPINTPNNTNNTGGWSFLEALSNVSQGAKERSQKEEATYVHPQQKRSSLLLSPKSLELCTENLGNESGTDIAENGIDMLCSTGGNLEAAEQKQQQLQQEEQPGRQHPTAKKAKTLNFPPPLTTIRGSESLLVRPHREDGRLLIEITKVPPSPSCFQADRSHGRLRLCFLKNHDPSFDPEGEDDAIIDENEPTTNEGLEEEFGNEATGQAQHIEEQDRDQAEEEEETEDEETEEEAGEEEYFACGCEEIKDGGDMRMEKFEIEMPRRCKEGGDHENNELLLNWGEQLLVASS